MPPHILVDFVVLRPWHGRNVTEFWGCDAHETQLRCPDDVSGDTGGCSARRPLKPKFYQPTQTMVIAAGILLFRENSHGRAGNRTRDLIISSQRLWVKRNLRTSFPYCKALLKINIYSTIPETVSFRYTYRPQMAQGARWLNCERPVVTRRLK